jgi:hypothetical protein
MIALLNTMRGYLAADGVPKSKPVWNTEVNYGLKVGAEAMTPAVPISNNLQVAYLMRTYLLSAAQGVKQVDWYAYDLGLSAHSGSPLANTLLTDPYDLPAGTLTPAGYAFSRVESWLSGTLVGTPTRRPCLTDKNGTYTCTIDYSNGTVGRIYWNPYRGAKVTLAASAHAAVDELGSKRAVSGGSKLKVNYQPVLVRSRS